MRYGLIILALRMRADTCETRVLNESDFAAQLSKRSPLNQRLVLNNFLRIPFINFSELIQGLPTRVGADPTFIGK